MTSRSGACSASSHPMVRPPSNVDGVSVPLHTERTRSRRDRLAETVVAGVAGLALLPLADLNVGPEIAQT